MAETTVVNLRRQHFDVYIGRAGRGFDGYFGNPFTVREHGADAIAMFQSYFEGRLATDDEFRARVLALHGKRLGCFCKPGPCHGDVIAQWVDAEVGREQWLAELAVECRCCGSCWERPCAGCQAGGICDLMQCRCDRDETDDYVSWADASRDDDEVADGG